MQKDRTQDYILRERLEYKEGELIESEVVYKQGIEPPFVKLYLDCISVLRNYPKSINPILFELLKYMSYASIEDESDEGGQVIYTNAHLKRKIAEHCGVSLKRVDQALGNLVSSGCIRRVAKATYQVNPSYFGKGYWKDIKAIRAKINFNTGEIETQIE